MSREEAEKRGMTIVASWVSDGTFAQDPAWFTTAPVGAMKKALDKASLSADAIDCYEINEAFSMVTLAAMRELGLDHDKVNCWGGAVSVFYLVTLASSVLRIKKRRKLWK